MSTRLDYEMKTYISILRGINVSGQKSIKMIDLKVLYESLRFKNVQTYIQSGNVVFKTEETDRQKIISNIEDAIRKEYGFDVPIQIRNKEELKKIIDNFPFEGGRELNRLLVTFLAETVVHIPMNEIEKLKAKDDEIIFVGKEVYLYVPGGYGKSKLDNNTLERKLKVKATTRNWKTINKLYEMCGAEIYP